MWTSTQRLGCKEIPAFEWNSMNCLQTETVLFSLSISLSNKYNALYKCTHKHINNHVYFIYFFMQQRSVPLVHSQFPYPYKVRNNNSKKRKEEKRKKRKDARVAWAHQCAFLPTWPNVPSHTYKNLLSVYSVIDISSSINSKEAPLPLYPQHLKYELYT